MPPPPRRRTIPSIPFLLLVAALALGGLMYRNLFATSGTYTTQDGNIASPPLMGHAIQTTESTDATDASTSSSTYIPVVAVAASIVIALLLWNYRRTKWQGTKNIPPSPDYKAQAGDEPTTDPPVVPKYRIVHPSTTDPLQYHVFTDYPGVQLPGLVVPQQVWVPANGPQYRPLPPIKFGHSGIHIVNLIQENFTGISDAAIIPQLGGGQRISLRICWHGYEPWSRPMNTYSNAASNGGPYNKGRMGNLVANAIREFLKDMGNVPSIDHRPDWWVSIVRLEELYLLELRNVSVGSWQPVICLRRHQG